MVILISVNHRKAVLKHHEHPHHYPKRSQAGNPESPRAQRLAALGAELCVADNLDEASLRAAFRGAHGIYAIVDMHQDQWSEYYCLGHGVPTWYAGFAPRGTSTRVATRPF